MDIDNFLGLPEATSPVGELDAQEESNGMKHPPNVDLHCTVEDHDTCNTKGNESYPGHNNNNY